MTDNNEKEKYVYSVFQSIAENYDSANLRISLGFHLLWKKRAIRDMCRRLPREAEVLDIGCGTGDMLRLLHRERPDLRITGMDFSPNMLRIAKKRCRSIEGIRLKRGNAMQLPFPDRSYDGACISFALRNTADYSRTLQEAARVLRPGGVLMVIDSFVPGSPLVQPFYGLYFSVLMPLLGGGIHKRSEYCWLTRSTREFVSTEGLKELMRDAGFSCGREKEFLFGACSYVLGRRKS